ncbi:MAG TPA: GntR family transcriptional regulator [Phycisphaerae bacterium]|nr:GntR family transcriptional regulator [Phycisphaerae bacterium]
MTPVVRGSKARFLKESLLREMTEQRIPIGARLPSESELMARFAVSRTTVRQALAELTNEGFIAKRQGRGTFRISPEERRRRGERSMLVGVWFNWPSGPLYGPMLDGIRSELVHWGYHAVLEGGLETGAEKQGISSLIRKGLDGFIVSPSSDPSDSHQPIVEILERRLPLVLIDKRLPGCEADLVATNNRLGAEQLMSHLLALGHRRIGFIRTANVSTVEERLQGYRFMLHKHGQPIDPVWTKVSDDVYQDHGRTAARELLSLPSDRRPTAVFGANDPIAETVAAVAAELGLRIPADLSVVGFDAAGFNLEQPSWLTTYAQPKYRIGQQAAQLLMRRIHNPVPHIETVFLEGELIQRQSTAPPREP